MTGVKEAPVYQLYSKEQRIRQSLNQDPIINFVDDFIFLAISSNASDIHLQPFKDGMRIKFRVDGLLYEHNVIDADRQLLIISRLKVLSSLDISQRRLPQDGKMRVSYIDRVIDLRISTFPTIYGEKMVIRILDNSQNSMQLEQLGFDDDTLSGIDTIIKKQTGFFLVTGPTGSGKTTTLYSILSKLDCERYNIVTMEDPVEYNLDGITQSQVNNKAGFSFYNGLRSLVRQDPDIIMIGEIRDRETATIAIEASLTGHLVLSTLHTKDSVGAITRLLDMGIEPFLINAALSGVLAQRLIRKLCENCKYEQPFSDLSFPEIKRIFMPSGCKECLGIGYKGRKAVAELLLINDDIRILVSQRASFQEIVKCANIRTIKENLFAELEKGTISASGIFTF